MLNFLKKSNNSDGGMKPLSEEEIQKRLYGNYRPGTLGQVLKGETVTAKMEVNHQDPEETQATLFASLEIPLQEKILTQGSPANNTELLRSSSLKQNAAILEPTSMPKSARKLSLGDEQGEELLELELEPAQNHFFKEKNLESLKLSAVEIIEKIRSIDFRFYWIGLGVIVSFVLIFSVISSYILEETDVALQPFTVKDEEVAGIFQEQSIAQTVSINEVSSVRNASEETADIIALPNENAVMPAPISDLLNNELPPKTLEPFYTVQVCVSNDLEATKKLISELENSNLEAFYKEKVSSRGKTLFFVYIGKLHEREEALAMHEAYKKLPLLKAYPDSFVTQINAD